MATTTQNVRTNDKIRISNELKIANFSIVYCDADGLVLNSKYFATGRTCSKEELQSLLGDSPKAQQLIAELLGGDDKITYTPESLKMLFENIYPGRWNYVSELNGLLDGERINYSSNGMSIYNRQK